MKRLWAFLLVFVWTLFYTFGEILVKVLYGFEFPGFEIIYVLVWIWNAHNVFTVNEVLVHVSRPADVASCVTLGRP